MMLLYWLNEGAFSITHRCRRLAGHWRRFYRDHRSGVVHRPIRLANEALQWYSHSRPPSCLF